METGDKTLLILGAAVVALGAVLLYQRSAQASITPAPGQVPGPGPGLGLPTGPLDPGISPTLQATIIQELTQDTDTISVARFADIMQSKGYVNTAAALRARVAMLPVAQTPSPIAHVEQIEPVTWNAAQQAWALGANVTTRGTGVSYQLFMRSGTANSPPSNAQWQATIAQTLQGSGAPISPSVIVIHSDPGT